MMDSARQPGLLAVVDVDQHLPILRQCPYLIGVMNLLELFNSHAILNNVAHHKAPLHACISSHPLR